MAGSKLIKHGLITALKIKNTNRVMEVENYGYINKIHARTLFFSKCDNKRLNDKYNKLREEILANILKDTYKSFMEDTQEGKFWINLQNQWKETLDKLVTKDYTSIEIKQKGGRQYNYDFDISYMKENTLVETFKVEFKYGGTKIDEIPQFFNADANKSYLPGYAEWFYDNYVIKEPPWINYTAPAKDLYMKEIYKNESKIEYFNKLKEDEKNNVFFYKFKRQETAKSIKIWLEENYTKLDLNILTKELLRSQEDKIFILWNKDTFTIDKFVKEDLEVDKIIKIKNNNTIIVNSKSYKIQYSMLLRWKNHSGILKPAWQISMKRI